MIVIRSQQRPAQSVRQSSGAVQLAFAKFVDGSAAKEFRTPLIILHGLFGHKGNWRSVAKALHRSLQRPVFTLDLRNHGASPWCKSMRYSEMAEDVRYFIDNRLALEIGGGVSHSAIPVHLIGHSMGGKAAMHLALTENAVGRIRSLIVEDISPRGYNQKDQAHKQLAQIVAAMRAVNVRNDRNAILAELTGKLGNHKRCQFLVTNLIRNSDDMTLRWQLNLASIAEHIDELFSSGVPDKGTFDLMSLFVYGSLSDYLTENDRPEILRRFPNAKFQAVQDAAHWVHADKPNEFIDLISKFIHAVEADHPNNQ